MLEVRDLEVVYGKVRAVQGISFDVSEGEIVTLIGANGAGKSSTMHAISGIVRPAAGTVRYDGSDITRMSSARIVRSGIAQVPEGRLIFAGLTIEENLRSGALALPRGEIARRRREVLELFPVLAPRLQERASNLSGGQLQMLALARGLMAAPRLLLLDEPSLGLSPISAQEVFDLIVELKARGLTILLVEQNVRQVLEIADRGYVLESGRVTLSGTAPDLKKDKTLIDTYLGIATGKTPPPHGPKST